MPTVIIIDDEKDIRESLQRLLEIEGFTTFAAADGEEGLEIVFKENPEIAIVDINMPGMSGIDVLKEMKSKGHKAEVILITGFGELKTAISAMKMGAFGYISKPLYGEELLLEVKKALNKLETNKVLEKSGKQFRSIVETATDAIVGIDSKGKIFFWNPAAESLFGWPHDEILGQAVEKVFPESVWKGKNNIFEEYSKTGTLLTNNKAVAVKGMNRKGKLFPVELSLSSWTAEENRYLTAIIRDISERVRMQNNMKSQQTQLVQLDKMASLGTMAAGVVHEINNPLNVATGDIHLLRRDMKKIVGVLNALLQMKLPPEESAKREQVKKDEEIDYLIEHVDTALLRCKNAMQRISEIVSDLKEFSRLDEKEIAAMDVQKAIVNTLQFIPKKYKEGIEIKTDCLSNESVECHGRQIHQVFLNIIVNSLQAMNNTGVLQIETASDGRYVMIKFIDSGHGIPEEKLEKVFDSFFTTKPVGEGTGLGLSISHKIIKDHGGEITVVNNPDKGVTFTVKLLKIAI